MATEKLRYLKHWDTSRSHVVRQGLDHQFNTIDYVGAQTRLDEDYKALKAFYDGFVVSTGRGLAGLLKMGSDLRVDAFPQYQGNYKNETVDNLLNSSALTPYNVKADSGLGQIGLDLVTGAGSMVGSMATSAIGTAVAGPAGGVAGLAATSVGNQYNDMRDAGVASEKARRYAIPSGVAVGLLEKTGLGKILKTLPANSVWQAKARKILENAVTEALTEGAQTYVEGGTLLASQDKSVVENLGDLTDEALYSGFLGFFLGGGASSIRVATTRGAHEAKLEAMAYRIEKARESGATPELLASTVDINLQNASVSVAGDTIATYAQQVSDAQEFFDILGLDPSQVEKAVQNGASVEITDGRFLATAKSYNDFFETVQDDLAFDNIDYTINGEKLRKALSKEQAKLAETDAEFVQQRESLVKDAMENGGLSKREADNMATLVTARAMVYDSARPSEFLKRYPLSFQKDTAVNGGYNQEYHRVRQETQFFSEQIDRWQAGKFKTTQPLAVGRTPDRLVRLGAKQLPIEISQKVLTKIVNDEKSGGKHGLGVDIVKQLPKQLSEPVMVFQSKTVPDSFVVLTELFDSNDEGVIVAVHLDKQHYKHKVNAVASVYGRKNSAEFVARQNGKLLYMNKKKSRDWLRPRGLQLPNGEPLSSSNDIITDEKGDFKGETYNQSTRGNINFAGAQSLITFFKGKNSSTVIHELGHYFVETLRQDSLLEGANTQAAKDMQVLLDYAGIKEDWNRLTEAQRTAAHERWAEGFESYIMEGKAPSKELRGVFSRFAKWLRAVYQTISRSENAAELTDEVRQVFDRMLASEEDIALTERTEGYFKALPDVITENLSDATKRKLEDYIERARDMAVNLLTKESLVNFTDERKEEIANYREALLPDIRQRIAEQPLYKAESLLKETFEGYKTGKQAASDYKALLARTLDFDAVTLSEAEEAYLAQFDMIAELNGFTSGDELAQRFIEEPTFESAVRLEAQEIIQIRYPDIRAERSLAEQAAKEALYNDDSGLVLGVEQILIEDKAFEGLAAQRNLEARARLAQAKRKQAEVSARDELGSMKIKDAINPGKFIVAERRAYGKCMEALAKKDYVTALRYKDMQALNHAMAKESVSIRKRLERSQRYIRSQYKARKEAFGTDEHFVQAAELLSRLGFARKDYDPVTRAQSLTEYVNLMNDLYDNADMAGWILEEKRDLRRPIENLTIEEYEDVADALRNIRAIVRAANENAKMEKGKTFGELKAATLDNLDKLETRWKPETGEKKKAGWRERFFAALRNSDNFFEKMDRWSYGFFSKNFGENIREANDNEVFKTMIYQDATATAYKEWMPSKKAEKAAETKIMYPELGKSVNKYVLVRMLQNLGNKSSSDKLCARPESEVDGKLVTRACTFTTDFPDSTLWVANDIEQTKANLLEFLGRVLTKEDIRYAQKMINAQNLFWDEISAMEKRVKGFAPKKVEALPSVLTLASGEQVVFEGGYFPLIRNRQGGSHPVSQDAILATDDKRPGFGVRTLHTSTGHTKMRDSSVYPIDLSRGGEHDLMLDAIHDLCYREVMGDFRKILNDPEMYIKLKEKLGLAGMQVFEEYLKKAAQPYGGGGAASMAEQQIGEAASWLRRKTVNAAIMLSMKTAMQNLANPLLYGRVVDGYGYADVFAAYANFTQNMQAAEGYNSVKEFVYSLSPFMKERGSVPDITVRDIKNEDKLNPVEQKTMEWGTQVLVFTDNLSALPNWLQAYTKQINAGKTQKEAVMFADTVVRRTLGSSRITDVASIQRGNSFFKLITMFQGFFNTQFNQWAREYGIIGRMVSEGQYAKVAGRVTAFAAAKFLMFNFISLALSLEDPFEEDEDGYRKISKELLRYPGGMMGPIGQTANYLFSMAVGMKTYTYRMSAAQGVVEKAARVTKDIGRAIHDDNADWKDAIEPTVDLLTTTLGAPDQFDRWFFNAWDILANDMEFEWGDLYRRRPKRER